MNICLNHEWRREVRQMPAGQACASMIARWLQEVCE